MIASQVVNLHTGADKLENPLEYLGVRLWEIIRAKLPDIYEVAINHQYLRLYGFKVAVQLLGLAAQEAQVHIRDHTDFDGALAHTLKDIPDTPTNKSGSDNESPMPEFFVN